MGVGDDDSSVGYNGKRSGGRVAEGTRLEIWRRGNPIGSSNLPRSATF